MATWYYNVLMDGRFVGREVQTGYKSAITERDHPFGYARYLTAPYAYQIYSEQDPNIWAEGRTTAWFVESGYFETFFGIPDATLMELTEWAAFEKFKGACGNAAQLGATVAEAGDAFSMIASRAGQLFRASRALKRLRFGEFASELVQVNDSSSKIKRKWQRGGHDLSALWLEYSYGWKPLLKDIEDAIKVLEAPYRTARVKGKAKQSRKGTVNLTFGREVIKGGVSTSYSCCYGADISLENPNLAAASQAGLINPLVPLWEILPFSFVIDWFTPIGKFLENMSFGIGLTFTRKWKSRKKLTIPDDVTIYFPPFDGWTFGTPKADQSTYLFFERWDNWDTPRDLPKPRLPEWPRDRALNALSLTIQMLSSLQSKSDNPRRRKTAVI